ncbi:hypothetical protein IKW75_03175 [Candidatus Saccharibacteria bacterium]|nr:hypothetical protein [Candidatus Saccharibacteria bacterium]
MKKILVSLMAILALVTGVVMMPAADVNAAAVKNYDKECSENYAFFALKPWYAGLTTKRNDKCEIGQPDEIPLFVWTIVLNIMYDISILIGYIAIIMVAWGGYLYMFSRGLPDRAERGKKTLLAAGAGLAISMLASVIMNTVVVILTGAGA